MIQFLRLEVVAEVVAEEEVFEVVDVVEVVDIVEAAGMVEVAGVEEVVDTVDVAVGVGMVEEVDTAGMGGMVDTGVDGMGQALVGTDLVGIHGGVVGFIHLGYGHGGGSQRGGSHFM